jgi:EAL domain-containing protein (putative c-di-GMP-specific phosphodiesterase class I)/GGDEF domain-containing protein
MPLPPELKSAIENLPELFERAWKAREHKFDDELLHLRNELSREQNQRNLIEKQGQQASLQDKVAQLQQRVNELSDELHREVSHSSQLTLEVVDLKLALERARNMPVGSSLNLPDLVPEHSVEAPENQLQRLAFEDPVTSLPNRHLGLRFAQQELKDKTLAIAVLQIVRLSEWRLVLGAPLVDELLHQLGARLSKSVAAPAVVVRGLEDEIWVFLPHAGKGPLGKKEASDALLRLLNQVLEDLRAPLILEDHRLCLTLVGGYLSAHAEDARQLIEKARLACQQARREGRQRLLAYQPELEKPLRQRIELTAQLIQGWERDQFQIEFQPIVELATGHIKAVEGFLRWQHPIMGRLETGSFLEAALESGLMSEMGEWMTRSLAHWARNYRAFSWCVNISAQELVQADFVRRFTKALEAAQLHRPEQMVVEISERSLAKDQGLTRAVLAELRQWKVSLAIDDFGFEGYSLAQLRDLKPQFIKLAPHLVHNLEDGFYRQLTKTALSAAESVGAKVIAEGIENAGQLEILRELGCPWGQGHHLSVPLRQDEFEERLAL